MMTDKSVTILRTISLKWSSISPFAIRRLPPQRHSEFLNPYHLQSKSLKKRHATAKAAALTK